MSKKLAAFIQNASIYFGIIFAAAISLVTLLFTTIMPACFTDDIEVTFAPYIIIVIILLISILAIKPIYKKLEKINPATIAKVAFFWGLIASLIWVFIADAFPMWDSYDLVRAAEAIIGNRGPEQLSKWAPGSYMERYPYQTPIMLLFAACMLFAGSNYILFFEFLNCLACGLTMYLIVKYTHLIFKNKTTTAISAILVMLFAPLIIYATFIYGNLICLPFALGCLILQKKALDEKTTKKRVWLIIASIISGAIAVILKKPTLIIVLGVAVVYVVWALKNQKFQYLAVALISVLVANYAILPINAFVELQTGKNLHNGVPTVTWIAMGTGSGSEYFADTTGDESLRTDTHKAGYYDAYPWITPGDVYSPESIKETSIEYIKKRIGHYVADPGLFFSFYANKLAVSWAEPTFESFLASNWEDPSNPDAKVLCNRDYTIFGRSFYYGKAHTVIVLFLDALQTIIPVGLLIALISLRKKLDITQMGAFIAALGLFVVYLFWETKTQYMFPPFLLIIPFSAMGWTLIIPKIHKLKIIKKAKKLWKHP